ncbi:MAG: hypothetical protein JXD18_06920 [Anaerolineae bacterium]|nr:hypothetical protein [Anaerolineae bacterium]
MLPIQVPRQFRIIAHRGASAYAPENTQAAFDLALRMGAREIETDVQLTTDGQAVLCHDRTLARYDHGDRVVEETTWADLCELDMGSWFSPFLYRNERMMTLDGLLARYGPSLTYHLELKGQAAGLPESVAQAVARHNLQDRCIITSFSLASLEAMKRAAPSNSTSSLRLGWLIQRIDDESLAVAQRLGLVQLCPRADQVDRAAVAAALCVVPEVRAWGVSGSPAEVRRLIRTVAEAGAHGLTLDWPDWACHRPNGE